jgi:hypothetical protein
MMTDHALEDSLKARVEHMDQPRCPIGIFHERNWDIGKDFERIVEVGRGKCVAVTNIQGLVRE